jgi:hypothetical protein
VRPDAPDQVGLARLPRLALVGGDVGCPAAGRLEQTGVVGQELGDLGGGGWGSGKVLLAGSTWRIVCHVGTSRGIGRAPGC